MCQSESDDVDSWCSSVVNAGLVLTVWRKHLGGPAVLLTSALLPVLLKARRTVSAHSNADLVAFQRRLNAGFLGVSLNARSCGRLRRRIPPCLSVLVNAVRVTGRWELT